MKIHLLTALLLAVILFGCRKGSEQKKTNTYKTMTVEQSDVTLDAKYTAALQGRQEVEIRPQVSGLITKININEGDKVHKGQTLFVIDQAPYSAALNEAVANVRSAEAQLATAKLTMESSQVLYDNKVIEEYDLNTARNSLAAAKASLAQAQAREASARTNMSYTEVKSPVDGVAGMINYRIGALVNSSIGTPLVTVVDDSEIYAYFSMTESAVQDLLGQGQGMAETLASLPPVSLQMSNGQTYDDKGRVAAVSGVVSSSTGSVTLRADFPNEGHRLRSGANGTVIIPIERKGAILIPKSATYELQNKVYAYRVVDGKAEATLLSVFKIDDGRQYVVEDGLSAGDVIIAEGAGLVKNGAKVDTETVGEGSAADKSGKE